MHNISVPSFAMQHHLLFYTITNVITHIIANANANAITYIITNTHSNHDAHAISNNFADTCTNDDMYPYWLGQVSRHQV